MSRFVRLFAIIFLIFPSATFSQQVGITSRIVNEVNGKLNNTTRQLNQTDPVYASETITAGLDSHGEILLDDNSRIIVGPGSSISLDNFLVADTGIKSGTIKITKGAFRFLSGRSKKGSFKVRTALTTIGIRGTIFDVYVGDQGITDVILFSGQIEVCTMGGRCKTVTNTCDIVQVTSRRNIKSLDFLRAGNRKSENEKYDLTRDQIRFPPVWRAPVGGCDYRAAIEKNLNGDRHEPDPKSTGRDVDVE